MKKLLTVFVISLFAISCNPFSGINKWVNEVDYELRKQNEQRYENRKQVEDTARGMIAQYETDKLNYESVKDINPEIALQAKLRINSTVATYNEFMLKNSYMFKDNMPEDIKYKLEPIQ